MGCTGVDGSGCGVIDGLEEGSCPIFLDCDDEKEASEAAGSLRGDRRTAGGDLDTTMMYQSGRQILLSE